MNTFSLNILDLIDDIGVEETQKLLSDFSCNHHNGCNEEIEIFLKKNAIEFAKQKISITYLVFSEKGEILGMYALTHKPIYVNEIDKLSKTTQKRINRFCYSNNDNEKMFLGSAFLIAQLSKNYDKRNQEKITGEKLIDMALNELRAVQRKVGGGIVFLECENNEKLIKFYTSEHNLFVEYSRRLSENDKKEYIQMLRIIS